MELERDLTGWELTEKLDGIRAEFDGRVLRTRNGREIAAPELFMSALGSVPASGELFAGRGTMQFVAGAVRRNSPVESEWQRIAFVPFSSIPATICRDNDHALSMMREIVSEGGEGVVARNPQTGEIVKVKPRETDEASFVRFVGTSLELLWRGVAFKVSGACAALVDYCPSPGDAITFAFSGLTDSGKPRHASFVAVRNYE